MSIDRWMDKEVVVHVYIGILLSHKKEWNGAICRDVDMPRDCYTEWNESEREICIILLIMWNRKIEMNLFAKQI